MQVTAVYACVRVLAEAIAGLPVYIYKTSGKGKERVTDHPLYRILHDEPPGHDLFRLPQDHDEHLLLWGNAYVQIFRARGGHVLGLFPLLSDKMKVDRDAKTKKLIYTYTKSDDQNPNFKGASQIELNGQRQETSSFGRLCRRQAVRLLEYICWALAGRYNFPSRFRLSSRDMVDLFRFSFSAILVTEYPFAENRVAFPVLPV